ncbi:MAG: hypothetical protein H6575_19805 [Lewinellaceae bacterium]|nr:hypothetical protein [Lewinellaceae bacterium]
MTIRLKHYIPAAAWLLVITGLSVTPGMQLPKFDLFSTDKLGHFGGLRLADCAVAVGLLSLERLSGRLAHRAADLRICFRLQLSDGVRAGRFYSRKVQEVDDMIANAAGAALVGSGRHHACFAESKRKQN